MVLFPAVDVVSAYPLYAHSLGNTIMSFAIQHRHPIITGNSPVSRRSNNIVSSSGKNVVGDDDDYDAEEYNNDSVSGIDDDDGTLPPPRYPAPSPSRIHAVCYRLLAALPPIAAAVVVRDLGVIIDYTGLAAFAIAFLFPALLAKYSEIRCLEQGVDSHTFHSSGFFTAAVVRSIVIAMASALICTVGFLLVYFQ